MLIFLLSLVIVAHSVKMLLLQPCTLMEEEEEEGITNLVVISLRNVVGIDMIWNNRIITEHLKF
jgi:hypothetical protein